MIYQIIKIKNTYDIKYLWQFPKDSFSKCIPFIHRESKKTPTNHILL